MDGYIYCKGESLSLTCVSLDSSLSLEAKGLFMLISNKLTNIDNKLRKKDLRAFTSADSLSFDTAWKELLRRGYIKEHIYTSKLNFVEYELLSEPQSGPNIYYYDHRGELKRTDLEIKRRKYLTILNHLKQKL